MNSFITRALNYLKRFFLLVFFYPLISKKYRKKSFLEKNYSSRVSITKTYIFFNQIDVNIFKHFVPKEKIKLYLPKGENKVSRKKIDDCKTILINGTDYYKANILLIMNLIEIIRSEKVSFEDVYFKPHPRETTKNIELLKSFIRLNDLEKIIFLSQDSPHTQLKEFDAVLTAISSSINYFCNKGSLILLSHKASVVGFTEEQYAFYIQSTKSTKCKIISK